jgi:putative peptidoglycan lipid II flippase
LGGWLNAMLLYRTLAKREHFTADARLQRTLPMILLSSAIMGVALWLAADWLEPWLFPTQSALVRGTALATMVGIGLLVYAVAILLTGALGLRQLRGFLWRTPRA